MNRFRKNELALEGRIEVEWKYFSRERWSFLLRVAVCDDEEEIHQQLQQFFSQFSENESYTFEVNYFYSGEALLQYYKEYGRYTFHFLILDVEMKGMNGIETALKIRSLPDKDVQIIFLTSYPQYMIDSFNVQPFQYLIKPVSYERFETQIAKLCDYIHSVIQRYVVVKTNTEQIVLRASDIIAIEKVDKKHLELITMEQRFAVVSTLAEFSIKLDASFYQIYRSIIINLEHVHKFTATTVVMSNKDKFPLGRSKGKGIKEAYARYRIAQFNERG